MGIGHWALGSVCAYHLYLYSFSLTPTNCSQQTGAYSYMFPCTCQESAIQMALRAPA